MTARRIADTSRQGRTAALATVVAWWVAATVLGVAVVGVATPARAEPPLTVDGEITDRVGALEGRRDDVDAALERLRVGENAQLFVVFVSTFDGTASGAWAEATATQSG